MPPSGPSQAELRAKRRAAFNARFGELVEVERTAGAWLGANDARGWDDPTFRAMLRALALVQDELDGMQAGGCDGWT